jgi:hypothetical protein
VVTTHELPPLVEVFWEDHYSIGDDWFEADHKHEVCILSAVGYLVSQDDLYLYVACTYEPATKSYSAGTAVLKKCITEMHYIPDRNKKVTRAKRK